MVTNIKTVTNQQTPGAFDGYGAVALANNQPTRFGESWACAPGFDGEVGRSLPIPETDNYDEGLGVYTVMGRVQLIDSTGMIRGRWSSGEHPVYLDAGGDVSLTIQSNGDIRLGTLGFVDPPP